MPRPSGGNVASDAGGRKYRKPVLAPDDRPRPARTQTPQPDHQPRVAAVRAALALSPVDRLRPSAADRRAMRSPAPTVLSNAEQHRIALGLDVRRRASELAWERRAGQIPLTEAQVSQMEPHPLHQERVSDMLLGKSATNLLFHGHTSDPLGAGVEIATVLPVLRGARALGVGAKALLTGKGAAEAAKIGGEAYRTSAPGRLKLQEFKGLLRPSKHLVPSEVAGGVSERPANALVRETLAPARTARAEQKGLYSAERTRRIGEAQAASDVAGGGVAGHEAAKAQLAGELPKVQFARLREGALTQDQLDGLFHTIQGHSELRPYEKLHAQQGLLDAFEKGRVRQPSQIKLLQTVFGQDAAATLVQVSKMQRLGRFSLDVLNIPRSLMASFDVSAPFRQGLVAGARHPRLFFRNFSKMFHALSSERAYQGILDEIHSRPTFPQMQESGIKFTELGQDLSKREEQFMSNMAERIPVAGRVVHASGRAYTGFLDKMRADMFDEQVRLAARAGVNVEDRNQLRSIARIVNSATGRGDLGPIESWAPALNAMFFSPRLIASRVNMLNPLWYASLTPYARHEALRSMVGLGGAAGLVLGVGSFFGAKVITDPRNADFAKLRLGNSRFDVLGGFQQYGRIGAQLVTGKAISSTTGRNLSLTDTSFGSLNREDILKRFISSKFSPPVSFADDFFKGTDYAGQPFSAKKELLQRIVPLVAQDAYDLYGNTHSVSLALLGYSISAFGVGTQTYGLRPSKSLGQLQRDSVQYGLGNPPQPVLDEYKLKTEYDQRVTINMSDLESLKVASSIYERKFNDPSIRDYVAAIQTQGQAKQLLQQLKKMIWPNYSAWRSNLEHIRNRHLASAPAN
jgi:hypothetical protein